jgi:hypothetical protein
MADGRPLGPVGSAMLQDGDIGGAEDAQEEDVSTCDLSEHVCLPSVSWLGPNSRGPSLEHSPELVWAVFQGESALAHAFVLSLIAAGFWCRESPTRGSH